MKGRPAESGNVLFYILIGVALLAALSFAITQGGRDSAQNLTQDRERLLASEIIDYGDAIKKAVLQVRLRGVPFSALSFAAAGLGGYGAVGAAPAGEIFNAGGGGILYKPESDDALTVPGQNWIFTAGNEIHQMGTTCGQDACADLILLLPGVRKPICVRIDGLLHIDMAGDDPPADSESDQTKFTGTATYAKTIGDEDAALAGKSAGCFLDSHSGLYTYYEVLQAR